MDPLQAKDGSWHLYGWTRVIKLHLAAFYLRHGSTVEMEIYRLMPLCADSPDGNVTIGRRMSRQCLQQLYQMAAFSNEDLASIAG